MKRAGAPTCPEGEARSAQNALKHGLRAENSSCCTTRTPERGWGRLGLALVRDGNGPRAAQESFTAVPLALTISIERFSPPRCS
jgi:hypothetical protein